MKILNKIEEVFIGTALLATCGILFVNVILRYVFKSGIPWAEELIKYMMIWIAFIGASVAMREGKHVSIDFIQDYLTNNNKKRLKIVINLISFILVSLVTYFGYQAVVFIKASGQLSPALGVPMWIPYLAIPIGFALMTLRAVQMMIQLVKAD